MDNMLHQLDAWAVTLVFLGIMLAAWRIGMRSGRLFPPDAGQDPGMKFTEASMAILGLLLAFTFAMSLSRHDQRRLAVITESNAIGDFYTCATLLQEPYRTTLQATIREYAQNEIRALARFQTVEEQQKITARSQELHNRMTGIVAQAVSSGTPIAINLTDTLNGITSANAARLAAYEETLPWSIQLLLLFAAAVPSFLTGKQQGASQKTRLSGTLSFVVLVSLVIFVILDLNQGRRGLVRVNTGTFDRLMQSMGDVRIGIQ
jgi:hypothetical protein